MDWDIGERLLVPIFSYPSRFLQAGRELTRKPFLLQLSNFSHFLFSLFCSRSFYLVFIKEAFIFPGKLFPWKYLFRIRIVRRGVRVGLGLIGIIFLEIDVESTYLCFRLCLHPFVWEWLGIWGFWRLYRVRRIVRCRRSPPFFFQKLKLVSLHVSISFPCFVDKPLFWLSAWGWWKKVIFRVNIHIALRTKKTLMFLIRYILRY